MPSETVLIVEDDATLRRALADNFEFEGYTVATAADGEAGLRAALDDGPDLVVLDLMLPKINGYEICEQVRRAGLDVPIIMLTAKGEESDVVLGLHLGADDYVTKPFSIRELLARVEAMLRRRRRADAERYTFGEFELDVASRRLTRAAGADEVTLTPKEFGMLHLMLRRTGRALSRDEILRQVWGFGVFVTARSVDRCVNTLRRKIEADPRRPQFIQTVRDVGYRFECQ